MDEATETLKAFMEILNELNRYNELKELEIRSHLQNVDMKLELLSTKHENMELTMDSLVANLNDSIS